MALPRAALGLPELIVPPDQFPHAIDIDALKQEERELYQLMTAKSKDEEVIKNIINSLTPDHFDASDPLRPKVWMGMTAYLDEDGNPVHAWLCYTITSRMNVRADEKYEPLLTAGKSPGSQQPRQIALTRGIEKKVEWDISALKLSRWRSYKKLGLDSEKDRSDTWKRVLLRFWAAVFPDALINPMDQKNAPKALLGSSKKKSERDYRLSEQRWKLFNRSPGEFDLSNDNVCLSIAEAYCNVTYDGDWDEVQLPPFETLRKAASARHHESINRRKIQKPTKRRTIEHSMPFQLWRSSVCSGVPIETCNIEHHPSLDSMKRRAAKKAGEAACDEFLMQNRLPAARDPEDWPWVFSDEEYETQNETMDEDD